MNVIKKTAATNVMGATIYVVAVASFLFYAPKFFNQQGKPDTVLAPIVMLMLFVFSAAVTSSLVFGRPILWYLDGRKKESLLLLRYTLAIFFGIMLVAFGLLLFSLTG